MSFFVPYVDVFFHILHAFFLASYVNFVAYICVILSCSFSASLSSGTLVSSWFPEPRCQHFGKPFSLSSVCVFLLVFCRLRLVICIDSSYVYL